MVCTLGSVAQGYQWVDQESVSVLKELCAGQRHATSNSFGMLTLVYMIRKREDIWKSALRDRYLENTSSKRIVCRSEMRERLVMRSRC